MRGKKWIINTVDKYNMNRWSAIKRRCQINKFIKNIGENYAVENICIYKNHEPLAY